MWVIVCHLFLQLLISRTITHPNWRKTIYWDKTCPRRNVEDYCCLSLLGVWATTAWWIFLTVLLHGVEISSKSQIHNHFTVNTKRSFVSLKKKFLSTTRKRGILVDFTQFPFWLIFSAIKQIFPLFCVFFSFEHEILLKYIVSHNFLHIQSIIN